MNSETKGSASRCAVILGKYSGATCHTDGLPRSEFAVLVQTLNAELLTFRDASERSMIFRHLFGRIPPLGSAIDFARQAKSFDCVYVTGEVIGLPLALALKARRWKGKMVCVFHDMDNPNKRFLAFAKKTALALVGHESFTAFVTVSGHQADFLINECGVPPAKVKSVFVWVDDRFFGVPTLGSQEIHSSSYFMACGAENRDYSTLIEAASRVPSTEFAIYGHGYFVNKLQNQCSLNNVRWMPRVPYTNLRDAYSSCTAVIVPLNDVDYGAGVTGLVEALAAGKPVIVTKTRGIRNYTAMLEQNLVVPANDCEAMAQAIRWVEANPELCKDIGRRNRLIAEKFCSVDVYARMVQDCFSS